MACKTHAQLRNLKFPSVASNRPSWVVATQMAEILAVTLTQAYASKGLHRWMLRCINERYGLLHVQCRTCLLWKLVLCQLFPVCMIFVGSGSNGSPQMQHGTR